MTQTTVGRSIVSMVGNTFAPLAALATAPIMAHALGAEGRGTVAAALAPLMLATAVATLGLPIAVTFFVARRPTLVGAVLRPSALVTTALGLAVSAVVIAGSTFLAGDDPALARLIGIAVAALVPTLLGALLQAAAAGLNLWRHVATERLLTNGTRLIVIAVLAWSGHLTVSGCVAVMAISPLVGATVYLRQVVLRRSRPADDGTVRSSRLFSYGARAWAGTLSGVVLARVDQVLMTPIVGTTELGLYVVAVSLSDLALIVNTSIREVVFTADAARSDPDALARAARLSTAATALAALGIATAATWVVPVLFGAEFAASLPACAVLLLGVVLGNPGSLAGVGLTARGRPGLRSLSLSVACVANIVATLILIVPFGALGAALATLVGNVLSGGLNLVFLQRFGQVRATAFLGLRRGDVRAVWTVIAHRGSKRTSTNIHQV